MSDAAVAWSGLLVLGGWHGLNPAMGWLFAVALGLQRESRRAVWAALPPMAAGHALAILAVVALAGAVGLVVPPRPLRWTIGALLIGFGVLRMLRRRHPTFGGMQVGARELGVWSFLVATAHGAGLMVLPLFLHDDPATPFGGHAAHAARAGLEWDGLAALAHTAGYLVVTALIAVVVYEKVGLRFLRTAWVNLDLVWSLALVLTGAATVLL